MTLMFVTSIGARLVGRGSCACRWTACAAAPPVPSVPSSPLRATADDDASMAIISPARHCRLIDVRDRAVPYREGWAWQKALVDQLREDDSASDVLILLEHQPVYTLGTASKIEHVLFNADELRCDEDDRNCTEEDTPQLVRTERGGEVTYHGPGQLVVYPIVNLGRHQRDLHWYLRKLEDVVILMLEREYGIQAGRKRGLTGVWVGDEKVCAMGLKVTKWITMHGLALNVTTDLSPFKRIVPCGIDDHGVTSLHKLIGVSEIVTMDNARAQMAAAFCEVFGPYDAIVSTDVETAVVPV
jgi:lipoyl(octanoyl) transferase